VIHGAILAAAIGVSLSATEKVTAEEKPIPVYIQQAAAPPPPPPPPPARAANSSPSHPKPQVQPVQPVQPTFVAPVEVPKELPQVTTPVTTTDEGGSDDPAISDEPAGVVGGVTGGVEGGQIGGTVGGEIGGQTGGVIGGTVGGVVGGTPGGTGTAPAPAPVAPSGPMRVGGDVKAPVVTNRVDPDYTEPARRARVQGVVIVEAIIDKNGNVDQVKVIRGLPMGLSESAATAVRRWKFKPGTLGGQPVDVIFNLTVVFRLGADSPSVSVSKKSNKPAPAPVTQPSAPSAPPAAAQPPAEAPPPAAEPAMPEPPATDTGGDPTSPPGQ
jgi:protein TonB